MAETPPSPTHNTPTPVYTPAATTSATAAVKNFTIPSTATTPTTATTTMNNNGVGGSSTPPHRRDPPKNLRGLNKPKCSKCGNVARSRCPYESCKSCCFKAQNPCNIHVLKANVTLPDKTPAASSPLLDQKSTDASPSGPIPRFSSFRQLNHFQGTQVPIRPRRPLTRKEAADINEWRFSKLKEFNENNIETENEAFDRYVLNVSLLEETFSIDSSFEDESTAAEHTTSEEDYTRRLILGLKAQLRSNSQRADTFRQDIQDTVDLGLSNLRKLESNGDEEMTSDDIDLDGLEEFRRAKKLKTWREERAAAFDDLIDKIDKAQNMEDLEACILLKSQLLNKHDDEACPAESKEVDTAEEPILDNACNRQKKPNDLVYGECRKVEIDEITLQSLEARFAYLDETDQIDDL